MPNDFAEVVEFARSSMNDTTVDKQMSKASYEFARSLLEGRGLQVKINEVVDQAGTEDEPNPYSWTVQTSDGENINKGEHRGTPGAQTWFEQNYITEKCAYQLLNITGSSLPSIKGNRKRATGKCDLCIGNVAHMNLVADAYEHARGVIELKTDKSMLKRGQHVLELASLSIISRFGKGVVLLGTDCNKQWELCYFSDSKTICRTNYKYGRKCWDDFMALLDTAEKRGEQPPPTSRLKAGLDGVEEEDDDADEQDTTGFPLSTEDANKLNAIGREQMLNLLADDLATIYGERLVIPEWAKARSNCPNYYM